MGGRKYIKKDGKWKYYSDKPAKPKTLAPKEPKAGDHYAAPTRKMAAAKPTSISSKYYAPKDVNEITRDVKREFGHFSLGDQKRKIAEVTEKYFGKSGSADKISSKDKTSIATLKKESKAKVKERLSDAQNYLKKLKSEGHSKDHKRVKQLERSIETFKETSTHLIEALSKKGIKPEFSFSGGRPGDYGYTFTVGVNKNDLKAKFPKEFEQSSAGLASSKLDNFAADQFGKMLKDHISGDHSSRGFSSNGREVHFTIVSGTDHGSTHKSIKK